MLSCLNCGLFRCGYINRFEKFFDEEFEIIRDDINEEENDKYRYSLARFCKGYVEKEEL